MLQRVQSLFLFAITIIHLLLLFVPSAGWVSADGNAVLTALKIQYGALKGFPAIFFLVNFLVVALSVVTIFLYRNRKTQMTACRFIFIALIVHYAVVLYYITNPAPSYAFEPARSPGLIFPLVSLILTWLALRNIRKDDELIRSVDRIR